MQVSLGPLTWTNRFLEEHRILEHHLKYLDRHIRLFPPDQNKKPADELKSHSFLVHFSDLYLSKKTDLCAEIWNN